jgi:pimeloyl-ACP methyl ester carboxylesterase
LQQAKCANQVRGVDLPGTGQFIGLTAPLSIEETAIFVASQIPEPQPGSPARVLVAISLGGMVAWQLALQAEPHFHRIFMINTSLANVSPIHHRLQWKALQRLIEIAKERDLQAREKAIFKMVSRNAPVWDELAREFAEVAGQRPIRPLTIVRQLIAASRYRGADPRPGAPLVLVNSLGDDMVHPSCSAEIARKWSLPLITHPRAGHDISIDDPQWLVDIICQNLAT